MEAGANQDLKKGNLRRRVNIVLFYFKRTSFFKKKFRKFNNSGSVMLFETAFGPK